MEQERYQQQYKAFVQQAEQRLNELCDVYLPVKAQISQAARYSLLGGGKRVRAVLVLAACQLAGGDTAAAADYAAALEMLHCYSLIHDDMPCMDNDDYRRGRLSCHKQYGEATALLAADALVTAAFEAVANAPTHPQSRVQAAAHLAKAAGARGMLYGQELDKHYETVHASESELLELHAHKTGALIIAGVDLGCDAAQADDAAVFDVEPLEAQAVVEVGDRLDRVVGQVPAEDNGSVISVCLNRYYKINFIIFKRSWRNDDNKERSS